MPHPPKPGQPTIPPERTGAFAEPGGGAPSPQSGRPLPVERAETVLETDEEIRQALLSAHKVRQPGPVVSVETAPAATPTVTAAHPVEARSALPFRPTARPPTAILTIFDDGKTEGEIIRIRDHRFVIGRNEGDLRISFDGRISARHVEITHQLVGGLHRWVVTDLQSTHGLYVRVSKTTLAHKAEFLVGKGRYRFDAAYADPGPTVDEVGHAGEFHSTCGLDDGAGQVRPPAVAELIGAEIGNRVMLIKNEYWIGSDPTCSISRPDDPFCEPRHVRLFRKEKGSWHAEHNKTLNGLWLRIPQITVESVAQFQIGEQRFQIKVK